MLWGKPHIGWNDFKYRLSNQEAPRRTCKLWEIQRSKWVHVEEGEVTFMATASYLEDY